MARPVDFIKDIDDGKEIWKFGVRLEDIWKTGLGKNEHIEFLILDKQGDNIQVYVPNDLCPEWGPKLIEGNTYIMKNFRVQTNDFVVKLCDHPFKLVFVGGKGATDVIPTKINDLPKYKLKFKAFSEIKSGNYRSDLLVDIIGVVPEVAPEKLTSMGKKVPTTFTLADAEMNVLTVTLWGEYGMTFAKHYNDTGGLQPCIVIIKHAQIKPPQGQYDLCVSNAWSGTKLMLDPELPEIKDFIKSLPEDFVAQSQSALINPTGNALSQLNSQTSQYSAGSRYTYLAPPTHLAELQFLPEDEIVTTIATPHHICISHYGWCYDSCAFPSCLKEIVPGVAPYTCGAGHVSTVSDVSYRVEVSVRYGTHKSKFLFCDRDCSQLIGKTAAELKAIMIEAGEFDPNEYPTLPDTMLGTELAIKIKMRKNNSASVLYYRSDPEIIEHIKSQFKECQVEATPLLLMPPSGEESIKTMVPSDVVSIEDTPIPTQDLAANADSPPSVTNFKPTPARKPGKYQDIDDKKAAKNVVTLENTPISTQDMSATSESTPTVTKLKTTPAKRPGKHQDIDEKIPAKNSSTKLIKHIKQEKIEPQNIQY